MRKFLIVIGLVFIIGQSLMAISFNDAHKVILESNLEKLLETETLDDKSSVLAAIAYKEYLNLLAENLILLSGNDANNAIAEELLIEFVLNREIYYHLVEMVENAVLDSVWHLDFDPPLAVDSELQEGAMAYSIYLVEIAKGIYPKDYQSVSEVILGYLPIAYQNRLFLVSVNPPAQDEVTKILLSGETYELDLDLQKVLSALSEK